MNPLTAEYPFLFSHFIYRLYACPVLLTMEIKAFLSLDTSGTAYHKQTDRCPLRSVYSLAAQFQGFPYIRITFFMNDKGLN